MIGGLFKVRLSGMDVAKGSLGPDTLRLPDVVAAKSDPRARL